MRMLNVTISINILLEILAKFNKQKKRGDILHTDRKEVKLSIFSDDIVLKEVSENDKTLLKEIKDMY